jgi:hypothetical protein
MPIMLHELCAELLCAPPPYLFIMSPTFTAAARDAFQ